MGWYRFLEGARTKSFAHEHPPPVGWRQDRLLRPDFSPYCLLKPHAPQPLVNTFLARLLKNQERPMVVIRCNYVRMPADESETIPRRILLD
jgi:hypothetical protein